MDAAQRARAAYSDAGAAARSPRQVEYQAFARITGDLTRSAEADAAAFPRLANALHENLKLWTIIAGDVSVGANGLPQTLRAQLFYLAEFTRAHTVKVLRGEAPAAPLIDINTAVMKGLRARAEAA